VSLRGVELAEIPEETVRVERAVFPKRCLAMRVRDVLGPVFADADFEALFPVRGRPAVSPASTPGSPADHSPAPAYHPSQQSAPLDETQRGGFTNSVRIADRAPRRPVPRTSQTSRALVGC